MKITKKKDHYLFKNEKGEYHLDIAEYKKLGKKKAIEFVESEIDKKNNSSYANKTIDFDQARDLGFCEYGIKDFCEILELDIESKYTIDELNKKLTIEALKKYPDECLKLFGKNSIKYLGTLESLLDEDTIDLFLREEFIDVKILHDLSVDFAYDCLPLFESEYPDDKRPREAIEAKENWIKEQVAQGAF